MSLQRVHEYTVDRATATARITRVNPLRRWVSDQHNPVCYQNGMYYWDNGVACDPEDVPQYIKDQVKKAAPQVSKDAEETPRLRVCAICEAMVPSGEYEAHLVLHARGSVPTPSAVVESEVEVPVPPQPEKRGPGRPRKVTP